MGVEVLRPRVGKAWQNEATEAIKALVAKKPRTYDTLRPAGKGWPPGCYSASTLDLVTRRFDFIGRSELAIVRLQRGAMVSLIRALREAPLGLIVGYGGNAATASYRTCALSDELYRRYQAGIGGKAVPGGSSWHNRGVAIDAPHEDPGARALRDHGWYVGEVSGDPSHCTWKTVG